MNRKESLPSFAFLVYMVFLVFSISCGSPSRTPVSYLEPRYLDQVSDDPRGRNLIEPQFLPLVENFELNRGIKVTTPIYFVDDLPQSVLGVCIVWKKEETTLNEIKVNRKSFGRSAIEAEMIIFHELGHCELGRPHTQDLTQISSARIIPYSLMYPTLFLSSDYARFHEHYIMELFQRGNILQKLDSGGLETPEEVEVIEKNGFDGYVYH